MADDIEQGNAFDGLMASRTENAQQKTVFDDLMANWTEEQRFRFIAEGHGMKRPHENEPQTSNKRQKR